jgi:hypothetical protein
MKEYCEVKFSFETYYKLNPEMTEEKRICGDCKHFISRRKDKYGFNGNCKEIVIKEEQTAIMDSVNLNKEDKACSYFEPKEAKK